MIGKIVKAKASVMKNKLGQVIAIGRNPKLPITVKFDGNDTEWDFKKSELEVVN